MQEGLELCGESGGRESGEAHLFLGDVLRKQRKADAASGEYELARQAVAGDADDGGGFAGDGASALSAAASHAIATLLLQRGKPAEAALAFSDAIAADPKQPMAFKGLGVALNAAGQWASGGAALAIAAELSARAAPSTAATFAAAAAASTSSSSGKKGRQQGVGLALAGGGGSGEGQLSLSSFRGDGLVSFHRAFSLWAMGDVKAAAERFGEATHMAPRYGGSYAALASLLAIEGARATRRDCKLCSVLMVQRFLYSLLLRRMRCSCSTFFSSSVTYQQRRRPLPVS